MGEADPGGLDVGPGLGGSDNLPPHIAKGCLLPDVEVQSHWDAEVPQRVRLCSIEDAVASRKVCVVQRRVHGGGADTPETLETSLGYRLLRQAGCCEKIKCVLDDWL